MKKKGHDGLVAAAKYGAALYAFQLVTRLLAAYAGFAQTIIGFAGGLQAVDAAYYVAAAAAGWLLSVEARGKGLKQSGALVLAASAAFVTALLGALNPLFYSLAFALPASTGGLGALLSNPAYWAYSVGYGFVVASVFLCAGALIESLLVNRK